MVVIRVAIAMLVLIACKRGAAPHALLDDPGCVCVCSEAGPPPDVPADAPQDAATIDLITPWTRTIVTAGASTGLYRGADGTSLDSDGCYVTAWEEGGIATRACYVSGVWATELVASGLTGAEDAKAADLDGDGLIDVVTAADSGGRVYVTFRGSPNVTTTITASQGHGHAMQVAIADINGDSRPDVIYGTRVGSPAVVAWLENPGASARTGSTWTYHQISEAGWTMSLVALDVDHDGDIDVVVSDRAKNGASWALYGARWEEQTPTGWVNHPISLPAGSCSPYPAPCTKTPGDEMFLTVDGNTVYDCTSAAAATDSRISIHRTTDWLTWTHEVLPPMSDVGHCQGVVPIAGGLAVSTWKGNALPLPLTDAAKSGVYWLHNTGTGWERGEISGPTGGKFDNLTPRGACLLTSEQLDPAGGLGVVLYCPSWM